MTTGGITGTGLDLKVVLEGTHRARTPEETWGIIGAKLDLFGITRVADITDLDCIGIPVFLAVRPRSETLSVAQGKGASAILARLSAVMESIELFHAERPAPPAIRAGLDILSSHYPIDALNLKAEPSLFRNIRLEWYMGRGLVTGKEIPVPASVVRNSYATGNDWRPHLFDVASNGLASGNTFTEATIHAIYEVVERHVVSTLRAGGRDGRRYIDCRSLIGNHCAGFVKLLSDAGVLLEAALVPNEFGIAVAVAFIWSYEFPVVCSGSGAHSDPLVALSRAISEAVQTRLTRISGTRDDIESRDETFGVVREAPALVVSGAEWSEVADGQGFVETSLERELATVAGSVMQHTGYDPIVVDLSTDPSSFSVVKVVCPGLAHGLHGVVPR